MKTSAVRDDIRPALLDPWFHVCLEQAIETTELVEQFDRLYHCNLSRKGSPLDRMIDKATGREEGEMPRFIEFVYDCVYMRVERPAEIPVPPWLTIFELSCRICGARNKVKPQQCEQARCGKCGLPMKLRRGASGEVLR